MSWRPLKRKRWRTVLVSDSRQPTVSVGLARASQLYVPGVPRCDVFSFNAFDCCQVDYKLWDLDLIFAVFELR